MSPSGPARADGGPHERWRWRRLGTLPLEGPAGEPVDLARLLASHGVATLSPQVVDGARCTLETTLTLGDGRALTVRVRRARPSAGGGPRVAVEARVEGAGAAASGGGNGPGDALGIVRAILGLDEDLSGFYALVAGDPALGWAAAGAGRMLRGNSVFEDVVKTICTTNCSWSATVRMVTSIVDQLGALSPDGRHAFPSASAMAEAGEAWYKEAARAGYRSAYLVGLARTVADGALDLDALRDPELSDAEVERRLLALPGVGPYAAAHIMLVSLSRYRRLVLDSWTRPKYARLTGRRASDAAIGRRFARFGPYSGLAFWLLITRDWVES